MFNFFRKHTIGLLNFCHILYYNYDLIEKNIKLFVMTMQILIIHIFISHNESTGWNIASKILK